MVIFIQNITLQPEKSPITSGFLQKQKHATRFL